jgi:phage portal protein BeeE
VTEVLAGDGVYAEHNLDGLLRADSQSRANFLSQMVQNGIMTRNEARQKENLPKSEDEEANKLTVQVNMTTVDGLGDQDDIE